MCCYHIFPRLLCWHQVAFKTRLVRENISKDKISHIYKHLWRPSENWNILSSDSLLLGWVHVIKSLTRLPHNSSAWRSNVRNSAKRHLLGAAVDMQLKHFLNSSGLKKQNIFFEIIYPDHNRVPISMRIFLFIYLHYFTLFMYASAATLILLLFIASCFINNHIPAAVHGDIRNMFCFVFLLLRVRDYSSQNK